MAMSNIPAGYKRTEVGVIPEDWDVTPISILTSEIGDGIHTTPIYSNNGDYYFINGNNLVNGKIVTTQNTKRADFSEFKKYKKNLSDRTIFLSINGTIGNIALYYGEPIILGKSVAYLNVKNEISKRYIYFSLQMENVKQFFDDGLTGTTIKNLGLGTIRKTPIALPKDKQEQNAIAAALSDADALITSLEKLIAKKRNIKQGAMQELLKPKEGWVVKKLGEVLKIRHGKSQKGLEQENGDFPIVATGGIIGRSSKAIYNKPSVLIGRKGTIDTPQFFDKPFWAIDTIFYSEIADSCDAKFIYYRFNLIKWQSHNEASGVPSLNARPIENIGINIPSTKAEQARIAAILTDMDAEIEALEKRLVKCRRIKQGMMQELLTGRIRLNH